MADGNLHNLTPGSIITLDRAGISEDDRFVVINVGKHGHRVVKEGDDPKDADNQFKVYDSEVLQCVEQGARKVGEEKPARDRTGEDVTRVVYATDGSGYFALLTLGAAENCRVAPIVNRKISGAGEKLPKANFSPAYDIAYQIPPAKNAILNDPASAKSPEELGLTPEGD